MLQEKGTISVNTENIFPIIKPRQFSNFKNDPDRDIPDKGQANRN